MSLSEKAPSSKAQALTDVIAGAEEDDEMAIMVRMKSFSVATEASKDTSSLNSATPTPEEAREAETSLHSEGESNPLIDSKESTPKEDPAPPAGRAAESKERRVLSNSAVPSLTFHQNAPFHKSRVPRKSVLKRVDHPFSRVPSTYDSTTTSPTSPTKSPSIDSGTGSPIDVVTRSPVQDDKKPCCVVM